MVHAYRSTMHKGRVSEAEVAMFLRKQCVGVVSVVLIVLAGCDIAPEKPVLDGARPAPEAPPARPPVPPGGAPESMPK